MLPPLFSSLDSPRIFYVTTTIKRNDGERCFDFEISLDDKKKRWKKGVVRWAMERKISEEVYIFWGNVEHFERTMVFERRNVGCGYGERVFAISCAQQVLGNWGMIENPIFEYR